MILVSSFAISYKEKPRQKITLLLASDASNKLVTPRSLCAEKKLICNYMLYEVAAQNPIPMSQGIVTQIHIKLQQKTSTELGQ